jgi:hypothetical protein
VRASVHLYNDAPDVETLGGARFARPCKPGETMNSAILPGLALVLLAGAFQGSFLSPAST